MTIRVHNGKEIIVAFETDEDKEKMIEKIKKQHPNFTKISITETFELKKEK